MTSSLREVDEAVIQTHRSKDDFRGFTIMELLVVIGILFVLVAVALVAMRSIKKNADRLQTNNALKQMMSAYISYATEHKGRLMPGYVDPADIWTTPTQSAPTGMLAVQAKLKSGHLLSAADSASYVWRLSPYLDHNWQVMFTDYRSPAIMTTLEAEYGAGDSSGTFSNIADHPAYGLNSLFLGGDSTHASLGNLAPWKVTGATKPLAISRMSDARNPAKLIVFAPSQNPPPNYPTPITPDDPTGTSRQGFMELRAPMFNNYTDPNGTNIPAQWTLDAANDGRIRIQAAGTLPMGVPIDRLGDDKVALGHLDGSVSTEFLGRIAVDMSLWDPRMP
jgi:type II secretory pathway pseudopilin PulG